MSMLNRATAYEIFVSKECVIDDDFRVFIKFSWYKFITN